MVKLESAMQPCSLLTSRSKYRAYDRAAVWFRGTSEPELNFPDSLPDYIREVEQVLIFSIIHAQTFNLLGQKQGVRP
jgi:hypothetical protein